MSTIAIPLAYRCTKCWQLTCADSDQAGQEVPCVCCATAMVVPEPTSALLAAGEKFAADLDAQTGTTVHLVDTEPMSFDDIDRMVSERIQKKRVSSSGIGALAASRWKRFLGSLIDSTIAVVVLFAGVAICMALGFEPKGIDSIFYLAAPLMFGCVQAYLIAFEGRTIGKYCVRAKIVDWRGNPPGFLKGVVLRVWAISLLGMIPFFNLVNILWIFGPESRCIHDYVAGTFVIDS